MREQMMSRTTGFDIPKHVNCYHIFCPFSDMLIGKVMPLRRSHIPVLSKSNFHDDLFIVCSPSITALDFGKYKQNK